MQNYKDYWYKSSDGLQLYARQYGSPDADQTIICIPGLTRNSADFTILCEHLATHFRLFAVDLRGRGNSDYDTNPANYHPGTYAADIISLLDELALQSAIIIGTSLGGLVSMILAATHAQRIAAAVLNDIGPEADQAGLDRIKAYVCNPSPVSNWDEAVAKTKLIQGREYPTFTDKDWLNFSKNLYRENPDGKPILAYDPAIATLLQQATDSPAADLWPIFKLISHTPLLLIRGELSDILSLHCVTKMQEQRPDMQFLEIPDCGHAPLLSETSALEAVDQFLYTVTNSDASD